MTNINTAKHGMATPAKKCRCENQRFITIESEDGIKHLEQKSEPRPPANQGFLLNANLRPLIPFSYTEPKFMIFHYFDRKCSLVL